jgi:hypothetical protein
MNYEEEMRVKNEMDEMRGDVCLWWGRSKKKGRRIRGWWEKKGKKKEMWRCATWMVGKKGKKKEKGNWEGRGKVRKVRKEKMETEKTKLVLFVYSLCLM